MRDISGSSSKRSEAQGKDLTADGYNDGLVDMSERYHLAGRAEL
jgi:hypothetical protein